MPSVGILTYSTRPRGSVVHASHLAEALVRAGVDATLYALSKDGAGFYRDVGCPLMLIPTRPAPSDTDALIGQRIDELSYGLRELGVHHDLYHAEDCLSGSALLQARAELGSRPILRTVHHVEHFDSPYLANCQRRSIEQADAVLSVSRVTQRDVLAQFRRQSRVIAGGVDHERFARRDPALEAEVGKRFRVAPDDLVVLSVGGIEERKNTLNMLDAVAAAYRRVPRLRWLIAGGESIFSHTPERRRFEELMLDLPPKLKLRVHFVGPLPEAELAALYRLSDVLLFPSRHEGFGLCVLEALASELCVLVSNVPPFTEYLDSDVAAFADPESSASITEELVFLLQNPAERQRLARQGSGMVRRFSWARVAEEHLREYRALLEPALSSVSRRLA